MDCRRIDSQEWLEEKMYEGRRLERRRGFQSAFWKGGAVGWLEDVALVVAMKRVRERIELRPGEQRHAFGLRQIFD